MIWTGYGPRRLMYPQPDDARLTSHLGKEVAGQLLPLVNRLYDEFYESKANAVAPDLPEMARLSSAEFKAKHPEISDEAVAALAWCYTFDYK